MGTTSPIARRQKATAQLAIAAIVLIAAAVIWRMQNSSKSQAPLPQIRAFFTVDDGVTYFIDDAKKIAPFPKDGRPAYLAHVFSFDGGRSTFVGYLERYTSKTKLAIEELNAKGTGDLMMLARLSTEGREVKAPKTGDTGWMAISHPAAAAIISPKSSNNAAVAEEILP